VLLSHHIIIILMFAFLGPFKIIKCCGATMSSISFVVRVTSLSLNCYVDICSQWTEYRYLDELYWVISASINLLLVILFQVQARLSDHSDQRNGWIDCSGPRWGCRCSGTILMKLLT